MVNGNGDYVCAYRHLQDLLFHFACGFRFCGIPLTIVAKWRGDKIIVKLPCFSHPCMYRIRASYARSPFALMRYAPTAISQNIDHVLGQSSVP